MSVQCLHKLHVLYNLLEAVHMVNLKIFSVTIDFIDIARPLRFDGPGEAYCTCRSARKACRNSLALINF